jgi:hypothetical protein
MPNEFEQLQQKVDMLERKLATLNNPAEMDPNLVAALTERIAENFAPTSGTGASANDQAVDEGGVDTYNVMGDPDGFFTINGKDVPYFN